MNFEMIIMLLSGMALFMFGMNFFEETIRTTFGNNIKDAIQKYAWWLRKSIAIGTISTAILQSSMVVIMIMLWFIWAWILNLTQGIGIVLWANIWSTITPWLIALFGFKLDIEAFTLPIIALWWLFLFAWTRYSKLKTIAKFLIWFGLLFLWLWYMKESVDILSSTFVIADGDIWLFQSIIIGTVMTIVLQTSTWSSILTLTALNSGVITFDIALGIIIGANLWSAVSTFIIGFFGSDKTQITKKLIASTHLIFNVLTMILILAILKLIYRIFTITWLTEDPVVWIAAFHTIYNVIWVIIFAPFVRKYTKYIQEKYIDNQEENKLFAVQQRNTDLAEEFLTAANIDVSNFKLEIIELLKNIINFDQNNQEKLLEDYEDINSKLRKWLNLALAYNPIDLTQLQIEKIQRHQQTIIEYLNAIKQIKYIISHYDIIQWSWDDFLNEYIRRINLELNSFMIIIQNSLDKINKSELKEKINEWLEKLEIQDAKFIDNIRESISKNKTKESKYSDEIIPQLIKINRSILLLWESVFKSCAYYSWLENPSKICMITYN